MTKHFDVKKIKKIQKDELGVLESFDEVCKKKGVLYSLAFGNLLGAIRHKGFIPWDDDVDIIMDHKNYEKLVESEKYFEKEGVFFERFAGNNTFEQILLKVVSPGKNIIFDIFVLRDISENTIRKKIQLFLSYLFIVFEYLQVTDFKRKKGGILKKIFYLFLRGIQCLFKKINLSKYSYKLYINIYNIFMGKKKGFLLLGPRVTFLNFSRKDIYPLKKVPYEKLQIPIMNNHERFLCDQYGDYMKLPEEARRAPHHQ